MFKRFRFLLNSGFNAMLLVSAAIVFAFVSSPVYAAHPLITDDTGTQGKGKIQIELNGERGYEDEAGITEEAWEVAGAFTYGIIYSLDVVVGVPYVYAKTEADGVDESENGVSDASFEVKWRFLELSKFSFAAKPGISFPTGDEEKGLGTGEIGYSFFFISTLDVEPLVFHANAGYMRNENKFEEEENLWHGSLACEYGIGDFTLVANFGMEKNADPAADEDPMFILGGVIYSVNENLALDAGFKYGLNKAETDYSILAGMTIFI